MTTSGELGPASAAPALAAPDVDAAVTLAKEIERLANHLFHAAPGGAVQAPGPSSAPSVPAAPGALPGLGPSTAPSGGLVSPPSPGPSALAIGADGASPALSAPPLPGVVKQPPLSVAPPPKESDLRAIPTVVAESVGLPSPASLASVQETAPGRPYFLDLAGLPADVRAAPTGGAPLPSSVHEAPAAMPPAPYDAGRDRVPAKDANLPPVESGVIQSPAAASPSSEAAMLDQLRLGLVTPGDPSASEPYFLLGDTKAVTDPAVGSATPSAPSVSSFPGAPDLPAFATQPSPAVPSAPSFPGAPALPGFAARPSVPLSAPGAAALAPAPREEPRGSLAQQGPSPTYDVRPELVPGLAPRPSPFDAATIRKDFPILRERVHGRPLIWLDNGATTQKPQTVIDRISYYYEHENSNVHRAAHALAARATDAFESARDTVRRFLNAPSTQEIVFVRGTTEAINLLAQSWGRRNIQEGDEIVLSWLEHHANIVPWQQLCSEKGARLRIAPVDDRGQVILEAYERLLGPKTRLVSFSHVSNALGTIVPAREMTEMAHRRGALVAIDGAQAVSHMRVDVQALDCDFYSFSGHKVFAPTGIGVLYGKREVLAGMPPWQGGGNMISNVTFEQTTYQPPPQRFEAGTNSIADAVGLGAALDYVSGLGMENISRYEHELLVHATEGLLTVPGLRLIGTAAEKAAVLSFVLDGLRTEDVGAALDQEGIAVRAGHHCAQPILRRFGLESTVRATLAPYNTREDIDALVGALLRLQAGRPARPRSSEAPAGR